MAAPESEGARSWADLPVDIVDAVVRQHLDLFSTTRLAAVCTSWAEAVATNAALPFGTPCLLLTSEEQDDNGDRRHDYEEWTYRLMDLTRGIDVSFPAFIWHVYWQWWVGGKDDWLAIVDRYGNARLLNPYTDAQIDLPRITGAGAGAAAAANDGRAFERIVVCATPDDESGYLVVGMVDKYHLAIARDGDESWTALRNAPAGDGDPVPYRDAVVHRGKVCAVNMYGVVYTWDIQGGAGACPDPDPEELPLLRRRGLRIDTESWKLAESADGRRLLVVVTRGETVLGRRYLEFIAKGVRVYEQDVDAAADDAAAGGWSPVTSLGDQSLFLGANYPFFARVAVNRSGHGVRPNCVCFARGELFRSFQDDDVEVFDLGADDEYQYSPYQLFWSNRYNRSFYQVPIWFRPRLEGYVEDYYVTTDL